MTTKFDVGDTVWFTHLEEVLNSHSFLQSDIEDRIHAIQQVFEDIKK